jgi:hypothetical protein
VKVKRKTFVFVLRFLFINLVIWGIFGSIIGLAVYAPKVLFWLGLFGIVSFGSFNIAMLCQLEDEALERLGERRSAK